MFDFNNLDENHEIFGKKKLLGFFKIETPKIIWIDEFVCLRSKMYSCQCGHDIKNKLKGVSKSQTKHIKFEEYYNCLFGGDYQKDCDNYIICSINHEMDLPEVTKSTLSVFRDKRNFLSNFKSLSWN